MSTRNRSRRQLPSAARGVPAWLPWVAVAIAAAGLAVSGYLTYEHFSTDTTLSCPNRGGLNCERVTSSDQSKLFGVPVAILGLVYFAGIAVLVAPPAWRLPAPRARRLAGFARLGAVSGSVCYVLFLVYAELFLIESICTWCTVVHALAFGLFAVVVFGTALAGPRGSVTRP